MSQAALIAAVRERFGPKSVIADARDIEPWLSDWRGRWHGQSAVILSPASTAEVAAIVTLANEHNVPLVPQGGNTGMVGGATPPADGSALLISLRRMTAIRSLDSAHAVAEAGVILETLHHAAAVAGRRFPLTLGARGSATIGGLVSTNAGGTQVLRFGTMRGLVAGVEAVLPDGSIHDGLAALKKDNRGTSIDQLFIGSEGTLGIVTAASLRLFPATADRAVSWAGVASPHVALALLRRLEDQTDRIEGFEIVPGETLDLVLAHIPGTRAPLAAAHPWHLLIEATAASVADEPSVQLLERLLAPALEDGMIADATIAANEAQVTAFWRLRDSISEAERAAGPAVQHDISVPVDVMPDFMIDAAAAIERAYPGTHATAFGHLGDGNVHFHVRAPAGAPRDWPETRGKNASRMVHDLVVAAGGSISAEHGIGQMKKDELARLGPPARLHALRAIKAALDPKGLMNPGKLIDPEPPHGSLLTAEAKDKRLNRLVALSVVALSIATGLGNIKDGNIVQAMAQAQANSLDRWNQYQATRTKLHIVETARVSLSANADPARAAPTLATFDAEIAKYTAEGPGLAKEAKGFSDQYDALNVHDDQFDASEASITAAISMAAVAALAESRIPLIAAWVFGTFGIFLELAGFLGWAFHPDVLSTILG